MSDCICCKSNRCLTSEVCSDGCKPGYHGGRCRNKCPPNCITCIDHPEAGQDRPDLNQIGYCTQCKEGYYFTNELYQCQSICPKGCTSCTSGSQCAACDAGHIPDLQNPGSCILCTTVCLSCLSNGCSKCKEGFFITSIQGFNHCDKCPERCLYCDSKSICKTCVQGWYGIRCEKTCSTVCDGGCNKDDGFCQCKIGFTGQLCDTCIIGRYGIKCTEMCPIFCQNKECERESGNCLACVGNHVMPKCDTCINGLYGAGCDISCPSNCLNNTCKQTTGTCSSGCDANFAGAKCDKCIPGKHGLTCQHNCPDNCNNSLCNKETGFCESCKHYFEGDICDKCVNGKYNDDCSLSCPINCKDSSCKQASGDCFACALNHTHGQKCNASCPSNCLNEICTQENGHCDQGCKPGYSGDICDECEAGRYGTHCEYNCSLNCMNQICNETNGDCYACIDMNYLMPKCEYCTAGVYGVKCDINCPKNCNGSRCERNTGKCSSGCVGNFSGETCEECIIGKFGKGCVNDCPSNCLNNICNFISGKCENCVAKFAGDNCVECIDGLYGKECNQTCPPNCGENICEQQNGNCKTECLEGFSGDKCCLNNSYCEVCLSYEQCYSCIDGKHGQTCGDNCPMNCKSCNRFNGSCTVCKEGYHGLLCVDATFQPNKQKEKSFVAPIAGTLGGIAVVSLVTVIVIWFYRRRSMGKKDNSSRFPTKEWIYENDHITEQPDQSRAVEANTIQTMELEHRQPVESNIPPIPLNELKSSTLECQNESNYYNTQDIPKSKIQVSKFSEHIYGMNSALFIKEFQTLPKGLLKPCTDARKPENLAKNRYNSIYPYDDDRVKLGPPGSDFINACYIDGYKKKKEYIASLGPILKATEEFRTFWRMVWQEKTEKIVMVTNLMEKGGMKCEKYWPDVSATKSYGDVIVTCQSEDIFAEYTLRRLTVFKGDEERPLYHIHYTAWPDKAVPDDVTSLIDFRQKVNMIKTSSDGPTIVHCSAGVGRTGTYIALDILTQEGETEGVVDVFGRVSIMRYQRTSMVQTWEQYEYLHHALVHTLTFDYRPITAEEFEEFVSSCSDTVMAAKFKRLHFVEDILPESEVKAKQRSKLLKHLNRKEADIPGDIRRPRLNEDETNGANDYINAVYLNSYKQKDRYILAMTPLPETVPDFLALLIQEKVTCVVSMDDNHSQLQGTGTYIPADNQRLRLETFEVKSSRVTSNSCYVQRTLTVIMRSRNGPKSQTLHHFQINHWRDADKVPHDETQFLQLLRDAEKAADDTEEKGTMVVHCLNAAERSCLFCAISIMLQKMDSDHEVSVVNTLRQVRVRRALAFPNKEQYVFCHKCICTHLQAGNSNIYTNQSMLQ